MSGEPTRYGRDTFDTFVIRPWIWDGDSNWVNLRYELGPHSFTERVTFGETVGKRPSAALLDLLAVVAGVSYFKAAAPRHVRSDIALTSSGQRVAALSYDEGLREFAFRNSLDVPLMTELGIPTSTHEAAAHQRSVDVRPLVTLGGGRDSALVAACLRDRPISLMTSGTNEYADRIGDVLGHEVTHASRRIDPLLIELNGGPALNGHVPVTGINSLVAACTAEILGCADVVMANEASSSRASHVINGGHEINHQFSKSWPFERALTTALHDAAGMRYFSAIRPWGELAVGRAFSRITDLHPVVMSCNRAFIRNAAHRSDGWCATCDKCRFVYLSLAPFMSPAALSHMFGSDLLNDDSPAAVDGFHALFAESERPWDCVGEPEEVRCLLGLLIESAEWRDHAVVRALQTRVGTPSTASLDALLAPRSDHGIPVDYYDTIARAFA